MATPNGWEAAVTLEELGGVDIEGVDNLKVWMDRLEERLASMRDRGASHGRKRPGSREENDSANL